MVSQTLWCAHGLTIAKRKRQELDDSQMCVFGYTKFAESNMLILLKNMSNWLMAHELHLIGNDTDLIWEIY